MVEAALWKLSFEDRADEDNWFCEGKTEINIE